MKFEGRTKILVILVIAAVGVSGLIEAFPHAHETMGDLMIDAAILATVLGISYILARLFGRRGSSSRGS
jgi:hypothetical protein